jgi:acetyl esterase
MTEPQGYARLQAGLRGSSAVMTLALGPDLLTVVRSSLNERRALAARELDVPSLSVGDTVVDTHAGPVTIRVYRPRIDDPAPVLVFFHSGALVLGNLDTDHARCARLARDVGCVIVSVDYRLAPEHPYPAALEDCVAVVDAVCEDPGRFGADPQRLAVGGNSAGAGLAAAVCLWLRDHDRPAPLLQLLHQPMLDARLATSSMREFVSTPGFDSLSARFAWDSYLAGQPATSYASASLAESLSDLPPAHITCSELDPLRDEAIAYAQRLLQAGVPTDLVVVSATCHGYDSIVPDLAVSVRTEAEQARVLRGAFAGAADRSSQSTSALS